MFYQTLTLISTQDGQGVFSTWFLELDDKDPYIKYTKMIIDEILRQKIKGIPNAEGIPHSTAMPKLVMLLSENLRTKYSDTFDLAIECISKRSMPDWVSEKVMRKNHHGQVFAPMGCVDGEQTVIIEDSKGKRKVKFSNFWNEYSNIKSPEKHEHGEFIRFSDVKILDRGKLVGCYGIIRNTTKVRYKITLDSSLVIHCTPDHPFPIDGKGRTLAEDLQVGDIIEKGDVFGEIINIEILSLEEPEYSYDVTTSSDRFDVSGINSHNCRSFLSDKQDEHGNYFYNGRFNKGVVSISLPRVALKAKGDENLFFDILDRTALIAKEALQFKVEQLKGTKAERAPLLFMHGAISRKDADETIDDLLYDGYSTLSLGYVGLHEALKILYNFGIETDAGHEKALAIVKRLRGYCDERNKEENLGYSLYATPAETTVYTFNQKDKELFGEDKELNKGIFDHKYYTNSFHINVRTPFGAFDKLKMEAPFHEISSGGAISFVECGDLSKNLEALKQLSWFMYNTVQYAEFNFRNMDVCSTCGFVGELEIADEKRKCPQCGETDQRKLVGTKRICGYLTTNLPNKGKMNELNERVYHI